jgi:tubulin epsilon
MLALNVLIEHADCVLPVDNQALFDIVGRIDGQYQKEAHKELARTNAEMIKSMKPLPTHFFM